MTIRLPFETKAGNFSEAETFMQLIEYLRLAQEAAASLGHYRKANDDKVTGALFLAYSEAFGKAVENVTDIATNKTAKWRQQ